LKDRGERASGITEWGLKKNRNPQSEIRNRGADAFSAQIRQRRDFRVIQAYFETEKGAAEVKAGKPGG
jgi:hypothetical protein